MLSVETEARIAKILLALAEGERSIEISRQVLSDNYDFDPYQIFKYLDLDCKNAINACDILNFLRCKGIYANEDEVNFIILSYDQNGDGCLSYSEFTNLIQSDKSLKNYSSSNNCNNQLSFNVEYSLKKLFEKEIDLARNMINLLQDLRCRCDYDSCNIFNALKSFCNITPDSIKCFLERNCASFLDNDIKAIMKRLDFNHDCQVDLCELSNFLEYPKCVPNICCKPIFCPPKCEPICCPPKCEPICCPPKCEPICCPPKICDPCPPKICCDPCTKICCPNICCDPLCCPPKVCCDPCCKVCCPPIRCCSPCPSPRRCFSTSNSPIRDYNVNLQKKTENILNSSNYNTQNTTYMSSPMRTRSPIRNCSPEPYSTKVSNNLSLRLSPQRKCPPCCICYCDPCCCKPICCSPMRTSSMNSPMRMNSPIRMNSPMRTNNLNSNYNYCNPNEMEERQLKDYLKNVMDAERDIEQMKTDLALKCDFNVEDAFRIFECNNCNCLTCDDLKCGLRLLDIYATDSDIRGLMRRFDLNKKGYLNYSDFFDMVVPYEKDYRNMVECRNSNNCCPSNCNPDVFMFSTKLALKNLFKSLIDYENKFNNMKSCYSSLRCKLRDVFRNLDQCSFGSFSSNDLQCYLQKNCVMGNSKDADLLFIRLDKNRDGKVDYCEFEDELQTQY